MMNKDGILDLVSLFKKDEIDFYHFIEILYKDGAFIGKKGTETKELRFDFEKNQYGTFYFYNYLFWDDKEWKLSIYLDATNVECTILNEKDQEVWHTNLYKEEKYTEYINDVIRLRNLFLADEYRFVQGFCDDEHPIMPFEVIEKVQTKNDLVKKVPLIIDYINAISLIVYYIKNGKPIYAINLRQLETGLIVIIDFNERKATVTYDNELTQMQDFLITTEQFQHYLQIAKDLIKKVQSESQISFELLFDLDHKN